MKLRSIISHKSFIVILLIFGSMHSCKNGNCLQTAGSESSENRILEPFKSIDIYNFFDVYLISDTSNKIEIKAGTNLITNIETSVSEGVLTIRDLNTCTFIKGYEPKKLYIHVDTLEMLTIQDGINLYTIDTLDAENLLVWFISDIGHCDMTIKSKGFTFQVWYGSGDYMLNGIVETLFLYAGNLSFIDARNLHVDNCIVTNESMGDCFVYPSGNLNVKILDSGNIYYWGNPSEIVMEDRSGSGNLIKMD